MIFSPTILYIDIHLSQGAKDGVWYKLTSNFKEVEGNSSLNTFTGKFITGGLSVVAYYLIDVRGGEYYFLTSLLRRISCTGVYLCSWQRPVSSNGHLNYSQSKTFHASGSACPRSMVQGVRYRPRVDSGHRLSRSTSVEQLEVDHVKPGINAEIVPIEASTPREQGRRAVCTPLFHWWSCNASCR